MSKNAIAGTILGLLHSASGELSLWLEETLPTLGEDWWSSYVVPVLTPPQQQRVKDKGITSLNKLDLAALLRILDQNWYQLSSIKKLTQQDRTYVKEMMMIRNKWAHMDATSIDADDSYRDFDTLQRFVAVIDGSIEIINEIKLRKSSILSIQREEDTAKEASETSATKVATEQAQSDSSDSNSEICETSIVCLKSDPERQGVVLAIEGSGDSGRYTVFLDGKPQQFYGSQIELAVISDERPSFEVDEIRNLLTSLQIRHPSISTLYSLNAARIDFVPYQFRPALKIIQSDQPRLLIADGVGVGKTIEAGLIMRELQARQGIESVLIICPKPLVVERKWELEMRRFDERFTQLDGKTLRNCIRETHLEEEWPEQHIKTIIPYSLFDEKLLNGDNSGRTKSIGLIGLDPPPRFDLVIVDEAHHVRNSDTFAHEAVRYFCENANAVVFLTATPIQLRSTDLFSLLNLLRPDLVIDEEAFNHMAEPNPFINRAVSAVRSGVPNWEDVAIEELSNASATPWGKAILAPNPQYSEVCSKLKQGLSKRDDRIRMIREIEGFHSFSRLINRTRRRDIEDFCIRKPKTVEVHFTPSQMELHNDLLAFEAEALSMLHGSRNVRFMMSMIMRQTASCIFGLVPFIDDILDRRLSVISMLLASDGQSDDLDFLGSLDEKAQIIKMNAETLPPDDPKYDKLKFIAEEKKLADNNKLMIFSTFRYTLAYLERRLKEDGFRVGLIHGDVKDDLRVEIRSRFEAPSDLDETIDILLFSEVGCEGLDYQFCDTMVNYDLPWNPMKIEQRIGRIDRRGQKSEVVSIYNFITPGTVDADIYTRCLLRIGIFEDGIGESEEILGDIYQEIRSIGEDLTLTPEERQKKLEQLSDNEVRKIQEQSALEDKEHEFFGLRLPNQAPDEEIRDSESYWLSERSLKSFSERYIAKRVGGKGHIIGDDSLKTLRLSQEARQQLLDDYRKLSRQKNPMRRGWENWLKGGEQHCTVTFSSSCAADNRDAQFVMPLHPLILQAAEFFNAEHPVQAQIKISDADTESGIFPFAIYAWEHKGIREELQLVAVSKNPVVQSELFGYLELAQTDKSENIQLGDKEIQKLESLHHEMWVSARDAHLKTNADISAYRQESLSTSHKARVSVIEEQLQSNSNERIRTMKEAQLRNIEADYNNRLAGLESSESSCDIHARPIVFGTILIDKPTQSI